MLPDTTVFWCGITACLMILTIHGYGLIALIMCVLLLLA